jgi:hypothetical protein
MFSFRHMHRAAELPPQISVHTFHDALARGDD